MGDPRLSSVRAETGCAVGSLDRLRNGRKNGRLWLGPVFCRRQNSPEWQLDVYKPHKQAEGQPDLRGRLLPSVQPSIPASLPEKGPGCKEEPLAPAPTRLLAPLPGPEAPQGKGFHPGEKR